MQLDAATLFAAVKAKLIPEDELRRLLDTCAIHDEPLLSRQPDRCSKCLKALGIDGAHTQEATRREIERMKPNYRHD